MSDISDKAKLESVLDYIHDINEIVQRHKSVENALSDIEGQYALMMCLLQIGELVNKIKSEKYKAKIPVQNIVGFRNIIAHNYDGLNYQIASETISSSLPQLKNIIESIIGGEADESSK